MPATFTNGLGRSLVYITEAALAIIIQYNLQKSRSTNLGRHLVPVLFFLVFYGIVGVQLFGKFENHCVKNHKPHVETEEEWEERIKTGNITYSDLTIPDRYCNFEDSKCPDGFTRKSVGLSSQQSDFSGFARVRRVRVYNFVKLI